MDTSSKAIAAQVQVVQSLRKRRFFVPKVSGRWLPSATRNGRHDTLEVARGSLNNQMSWGLLPCYMVRFDRKRSQVWEGNPQLVFGLSKAVLCLLSRS